MAGKDYPERTLKSGFGWIGAGDYKDLGECGNVEDMPIRGHGIDIVETARIRHMAQEHGQRFLDRCFTSAEQVYCHKNPKRLYEHLAGRFAAKEAVLKVLGTGWSGGISWTDIEILPEPSGQPRLTLTGRCKEIAQELGICRWHVSISHIETHATASSIGMAAQR